MNPKLLLANFDRISDAPDAVSRLRQFILGLAVRGKLVDQNPNEEPAAELLKRICTEKQRLINEGKIRGQESARLIGKDEQSFKIPRGWCWARLSTLSRRIHYGYTASANQLLKDVRLLRITDIQNNSVDWDAVPGCEISAVDADQYKLSTGDILIARTGGTIGKTFLVAQVPVTAVFASYLIRVQGSSELYDQYLKLFLESPVYWKQLQDGARGGGQPNVNGQTLGRMTVTVPPLSEQHRIVAKVGELMGLCDRLAAAQTEREGQRHNLAKATLHHLRSGSKAKDIRAQVHFYFSHISELTAYPKQISSLREAILDLAVRGQLVPQNPSDQPSSELLKRIQHEKFGRIAEGSLRKEKPLPPITEDQVPFVIPTSWSWARIGTCSLLTEYGTSVKSDNIENGVPVLAMGDIQGGRVILSTRKTVPAEIDDLPALFLKRFDLLYNRTNSAELVGKTGIFMGEDDAFTFASYLIRIRLLNDLMSPVYINIAMNAPYFRPTQIVPELRQQCGQANVNGTKLRNMVIPVPPFAEQRRIVTKVEELMALCDRLEAQLTTAQSERSRLLDTLLHEALNDCPALNDNLIVAATDTNTNPALLL